MKNEFISIVVPIYNEEGNVIPLIESILVHCENLNFEILAVNDGSTDQTFAELKTVAAKNKSIRIINLRRNFGQTAALAAGIDLSKGSILIAMDGDGQNDPADIPRLLAKIEEGYDVVSGWRKDRKDNFLSRKLPSLLANALISRTTGVYLHDYGCTLKAYRSDVIKDFQIHGEMHRFLPAWCAWQGGKITEIPVTHHPRIRGKSKYGITRIFKVVIDLLTLKFFSSYLTKPNYLFSGSGFIFLLMSFFSAFLAFFDKFGSDKFPQYRIPLLLLAIGCGIVSVFLFLMGLLAELMVKLYFQNNNQRPYRILNEIP